MFIGCSLPLRRGVKALLCGRELTGALSADSDLSRAIGGLPTPRPASEIGTDGRVRNRLGADVTAEYLAGAEAALRVAQENGCRLAVLKEKSPSCGVGKVYDGSFSGKLVTGDGITVRLLQKHGIRVIGESEIPGIIREKVV